MDTDPYLDREFNEDEYCPDCGEDWEDCWCDEDLHDCADHMRWAIKYSVQECSICGAVFDREGNSE